MSAMTLFPRRHRRLAIRTAALAVLASVPLAGAQQPAGSGAGAGPDAYVVKTAAAILRVSAIKGFVRPWALSEQFTIRN